jgi:hypothetical protein
MTRLIHSYLTSFYRVTGNRICPNGVIWDLTLVFALTKKQLKYYIKGWVRKQNRGLDFKRCWKGIEYTIYKNPSFRTTWTPEMAMDLQQFDGIDAEAELTALLIENIKYEMRRMVEEMRGINTEMRQINNNIPNWIQ